MELSLAEKLEAAVEALRRCEERSLAGQFALEVMHEVRNPLDAIGNLVYLAMDAKDLPQAKEYMRAATEHIISLHQIAGQSLTLTRNAQTATPVDLVALSEAALRVHHRRIMAKQIQLKRDACEEATVTVRTGEILQVLSNLIGNALDALPQRGTISLRVRKRRDHFSLIVADNGHGISPDNLRRLFQPFFTTKNDQGTGLGLALSRKIVERHGGKIFVRSCTHPGKNGTTFLVRLPVLVADAASRRESEF
jgi:signal transduction histidine kinase